MILGRDWFPSQLAQLIPTQYGSHGLSSAHAMSPCLVSVRTQSGQTKQMIGCLRPYAFHVIASWPSSLQQAQVTAVQFRPMQQCDHLLSYATLFWQEAYNFPSAHLQQISFFDSECDVRCRVTGLQPSLPWLVVLPSVSEIRYRSTHGRLPDCQWQTPCAQACQWPTCATKHHLSHLEFNHSSAGTTINYFLDGRINCVAVLFPGCRVLPHSDVPWRRRPFFQHQGWWAETKHVRQPFLNK